MVKATLINLGLGLQGRILEKNQFFSLILKLTADAMQCSRNLSFPLQTYTQVNQSCLSLEI